MGKLTPATDAYTSVVPYITNFIDLVPLKNLYLHCNEIANFNQLTVAGNSSIIKKVNVTTPYLDVINDNEMSSVDCIDVSNKLFTRLNFRLTNNLNQVINLNGVDISCTLKFLRAKKRKQISIYKIWKPLLRRLRKSKMKKARKNTVMK